MPPVCVRDQNNVCRLWPFQCDDNMPITHHRAGNSDMSKPIVQYIVLRRDLMDVLKWPKGAMIAQACHACTAVIHNSYTDPETQEYLSDMDNMHKVVLEAPNEESLCKLSEQLTDANIVHKLWIEQPENIPTCIAAKPYSKDTVQRCFKKFKLFK